MSAISINNSTVTADNSASDTVLILSQNFLQTYDLITNVIITPIVCVVGVVLNGVGLHLLRQDSNTNSQSFQFHMLTLLIVQTATLIFGFLRSVPDIIETYDFNVGNYIDVQMRLYVVYIDKVLNHMSTCILLAMSIERLCLLVKPFTFKEYLITKRPKLTISVASLIGAAYLIPFVFCFEVEPIINAENITTYRVATIPHCRECITYVLYVETFMLRLISPALVLILNIAIPIAYYRVLKTQKPFFDKGASREHNLKRLTAVLLAIMLLYLLLSVPDLLAQILSFAHSEYSFDGKYRNVYYFFINLSNLFMNVNAGCAAIVYICASKRIWVLFKTRCCQCFETLGYRSNPNTCYTITNSKPGSLTFS